MGTNLVISKIFSRKIISQDTRSQFLPAVHCLQHDVLEFFQFLFLYNKHAVRFPCSHRCNYNTCKQSWNYSMSILIFKKKFTRLTAKKHASKWKKVGAWCMWQIKGSPVHVAPACARSGEGSNHFESYVRNLSLHFCKRLFHYKLLATAWS
jgi:hypothetical protein